MRNGLYDELEKAYYWLNARLPGSAEDPADQLVFDAAAPTGAHGY